MNGNTRYFVFIFPAKGEVADLLNLSVFCLNPSEKWPAHVTVAGPFRRRPRSRARPHFNEPVFSLGVWNFFSDGLATVYLKTGMPNMAAYWSKPDFLGDPVPHLSLYNGRDRLFAQKVFEKIEPMRLIFSFRTGGIDVVTSTSQKQFDLRQSVNCNALEITKGLSVDDLATLAPDERIDIAAQALQICRDRRQM